jgi:hypothetical protein
MKHDIDKMIKWIYRAEMGYENIILFANLN